MKKEELVIGIPREIHEGCRCVAMVPEVVKTLVQRGHRVLVEKGAGEKAYYSDDLYSRVGAEIIAFTEELFGQADVIIKLRPPLYNKNTKKHELDMMKPGAVIVGFLAPTIQRQIVEKLVENKLTGFAMELIPRISRAQSMDALSSLSTVMGYRAVLLAANFLGKFFPLLMTAAGTIQPANVLVIGAGVAGLQAIALSHRLGARVEAFDTRPAVKEQVESLGARFVEMELPEDVETKYGYAKEVSEEFIKKEMEAIAGRLPRTDVVITTALVYGRKAPLLITEEMVKLMPPGSVIIDLAAERGGNCELTRADETVVEHGVTIVGTVNLPAMVPFHASQMYSKNIITFLRHLVSDGQLQIDSSDEITSETLLTTDGQVVNSRVRELLGMQPLTNGAQQDTAEEAEEQDKGE